jgi:hypothetical protein
MNTIEQLREKMASTVKALENKDISAEEAMAICRAGGGRHWLAAGGTAIPPVPR